MVLPRKFALVLLFVGVSGPALWADGKALLQEVPDYNWYAGCFGTACGNLMGYWDRHGFPNFYTGPTGGGLAPLNDAGGVGIRSMWASMAGFDGRPANQYGHMDDYWDPTGGPQGWGYESTAADPYVTVGRLEHSPDCIGDFIGLNQKRWTNMNGECDGNINAYCFNYWETNGYRRVNYTPGNAAGKPPRDIQSGLREWTKYRGYDAETFSQLFSLNPTKPATNGFTYEDMKAEINAGYPVLLFLQSYSEYSRSLPGPPAMSRANPEIHGMLAFGYEEEPTTYPPVQWVYYRTSWAWGEQNSQWAAVNWQANMPLRGVIGYHPLPKIRSVTRSSGNTTLSWDGPSSQMVSNGLLVAIHRYRVEQSTSVVPGAWEPVGSVTTSRTLTIPNSAESTIFYRVRLLRPGEQ